MSAAFHNEYDVSPMGMVVLRLSADPEQIVPACGKAPWEMRVIVNPLALVALQHEQRLGQLLETLRWRATDIDPTLCPVEQSPPQELTFTYRLEGLVAAQMENGCLPAMTRAHHIARRVVTWLKNYQ